MTYSDQSEHPESFGQYLRRERELREIPLEEIAAYTRIKLKALEAIERDDYSALPPLAFIRAFIRCYADYIGLRPPDVMLRFDGFIQNRFPELTGEIPVLYRSSKPKQRYLPLVFGVVVVLIIMLSFWLHRPAPVESPKAPTLESPSEGGPPFPDPGGPAAETPPPSGDAIVAFLNRSQDRARGFHEKVFSPEGGEQVPPEVALAPNNLPQPSTPWDSTYNERFGPSRRLATLPTPETPITEPVTRRIRHRVEIKVKEPCWIKYIIDDDDPQQTILKPEQTVTFEAAFSVKVKIGNPDGVSSVIYNDQPFEFKPRCSPWWLNFPSASNDNLCP